MPENNEGVYLTRKQLAARWHISPGHLANLDSQGQSPVHPVRLNGGKVLYRMAEILEYEAHPYSEHGAEEGDQ